MSVYANVKQTCSFEKLIKFLTNYNRKLFKFVHIYFNISVENEKIISVSV